MSEDADKDRLEMGDLLPDPGTTRLAPEIVQLSPAPTVDDGGAATVTTVLPLGFSVTGLPHLTNRVNPTITPIGGLVTRSERS